MTKKPIKRTDPATITICDDQIPSHRASCGNKYEPILSKLKIGQAIKCEPNEVGRMGGALRKWIVDKNIKGTVRSMRDYGDGKGRVWLVALPGKEKATPLKAVA